MFEREPESDAPARERLAWILCQIIDDDAPLRWTRYRPVADCLLNNPEVQQMFDEAKS